MLEVKVLADTHSATSSLTKFDRKLAAIDKSSATATTRTTSLGKATGSLGTTMRRAAGYAAGAAAAYLSIAQAKAAVTTTQDLAKTTAGLNRNLGLTVKEGSRWAAVAKSRDIDSKALTLSFTTLSRRVVDATAAIKEGGSAADTALAPFKRLGIGQQEVVAGSKDLADFLPRLADGFGDAAGGAERQASAQQLLGRGYSTVLPLLAEGAKGLKEQQMWADKYGATLTNTTLKAQMKEVQAQRESKVAWLGLQVAFTKFVTPALEVANKQFQKITALLNDPNLTNAEKFKQIGDIIGGWASKALDAFVAILPTIISKAGEAAPKIAGALVQGFMDAPVWGKLVLGSLLLAKIGGIAAAGARIGQLFGVSFAGAATTEIGGLSAAGAGGGVLAGLGLSAGALALTATGVGAVLVALKGIDKLGLFDSGGPLSKVPGASLLGIDDSTWQQKGQAILGLRDALDEVNASTKKLRGADQAFADMAAALRSVSDAGGDTNDAFGRVTKGLTDKYGTLLNAAHQMSDHSRDSFVDLARAARDSGAITDAQFGRMVSVMENTDTLWEKHARHIATATGENWRDVARATDGLKTRVSNAYGGMVNAVGGGLDILMSNTNRAMAQLGVSRDLKFKAQRYGLGTDQPGHPIGAQTGTIVPGSGSGDKVPAMLEPGEVVINRKAVAAMGGAGKANAINSMVPRFASGGVIQQALGPYTIPPIQYDPNHAGGNSHVHADFFTVGQALAYGHKMQGMGWSIGEYTPKNGNPYNFGPITTQHQSPGHYDGTAFDANTAADETRAQVAAAAKLFNGGGVSGVVGAVAEKIKRVILSGPDGPLTQMGQAALDKVRGAANDYIGRQAPKMNTTSADGAPVSNYNGPLNHVFPQTSLASPGVALTSSQMNKVRASAGLPPIFNTIAQRESSWHPGIVSFDQGYGLWQITKGASGMDSVIAGMGGYGQMLNPIKNAAIAGQMYRSRGLSPWAPSGPYQSGGIVQKLAGGGTVGHGHGHFTPDPPVDTAHFVATLPAGLQNALAQLRSQTPLIQEMVDNATTLAAFSTSPAGSDLSTGERTDLISLNQGLLANLDLRMEKLGKGIGMLPDGSKLKGRLIDEAIEIGGLTGHGNLLLAVHQTLDSLNAPSASSPFAGMDIAGLQEFAKAVRYGAFTHDPFGTLPVMHAGGVVPGPVGADVPIMAQAGETVSPAGAGDNYFDIYIGGEKIAEHVRAEIRETNQRTSHRYRAGRRQ